jgi:ketosteroid isomerase-like protein
MERVGAAWAGGHLDLLRPLLHPEGTWAFVDDRPRVINDPDELVEAIRELQRDPLYRVSNVRHTPLTDQIVLGTCQVRTAMRNSRGHRSARYHLLLEVRDGLFYRSESFPSEAAARAAAEAGWASGVESAAS